MKQVYLSLGSNVGDKAKNLAAAITELNKLESTKVVKHSKNFETQGVDVPEGTPPFLNVAVELDTELAPVDLLEETQAIEIKLGRTEKNSFAPRTLDIDLLFYGEDIILDEDLTVPHPLLHERYFVLAPLSEIAPDFIHPVMGESVKVLLSALSD
ncbi:MAG: 2-amino-4-hydroxy-6-hydroxymethyldihydropteridine diphosphokinase [Candidatus Margulisiibacteriota bacterium]|jgi:2-amino-4-hydroxy-6-hydroxymethyldihydropteridine diphosphokinase